MRILIVLVGTLLASSVTFANSSLASKLGNVWQSSPRSTLNATQGKNEITMGYGGEDVVNRPTLVNPITTV